MLGIGNGHGRELSSQISQLACQVIVLSVLRANVKPAHNHHTNYVPSYRAIMARMTS